MTSRILKINYIRVAEHLCQKLEQVQDPDTPPHQLTFGCVHGILTRVLETYEAEMHTPFTSVDYIATYQDKEHLTEQYQHQFSKDNYSESTDLTQILFEDLGKDHFEEVVVSEVPGVVVWAKGNSILLPLVLISVS